MVVSPLWFYALSGVGGATVTIVGGWARGWRRDAVDLRASTAQADLSETNAVLARMDLVDKLSERLERLEQQNESLRSNYETRESAHREETAQRDKLIASQQLLLAQQQTEIDGLKAQVALLRHELDQWRLAAREGRDALRATLLAATTPPSRPVGSVGSEGDGNP